MVSAGQPWTMTKGMNGVIKGARERESDRREEDREECGNKIATTARAF
jgi:hypothetical protein